MYRIRIHGRGGQGIKMASRVLGTALFRAGFQVQDAPKYGAERRGAPIFSYVRADQHPINERGQIYRPDLVVVADDTLLAVPTAGTLQGLGVDAVLLVASRESANTWRHRLNLPGNTIVLPGGDEVRDRADLPHIGATCAGAAACLLGVIDREILTDAIAEELEELGPAIVTSNQQSTLAAFDAMSDHRGVVREGSSVDASEFTAPDWIDLPFEDATLSAPDIHTGANSVQVRTGLWRTMRPVIDDGLCNNCWWVCSSLCPDAAIIVTDDHPVIDYDHCKGCMVCVGVCPPHAISASQNTWHKRGRKQTMSPRLLTGNVAAAWGARLAAVDYIPAFPITPQTEIIETLGNWLDRGIMPGRMVTMESEHSMLTAAGAAAATGVRVFSATSSQGLLHAMEMLYTVAGWRVPFVLVNVSRGLSAPITLEADHNDVLAARDCGFLQIHCADCQEVLDGILMAYRLAEDPEIRLPVLVNLDGFFLSFTREPVLLPDPGTVRRFLPPFNAQNIRFTASAPESQAVCVLGGGPYSYFRYETHLAAQNGARIYQRIGEEFAELFGREQPLLEAYQTEDAEILFYMIGSFATKAREAVDRLRASGQKVGLLRPRLLRPFPAAAVANAVAGKQGIIVIDQNLSMGQGGILYTELTSALYAQADAPPIIASYVGGLGGRDITAEEFYQMVADTRQAIARGTAPPPRLLYTSTELREIRKLQAIAKVEREQTAPGAGI